MNVLDLFSGIGGFSLGLERAGMRTVAFCEIDPFCRRVLAKHWPGVPIYDDVRTLSAEQLRTDGIAVDVICGGFPCQDISLASGKGVGIKGERSGLWSEYARLIGELRPRYVIVENVTALIGGDLGQVLGDLAALRFDAEWHCLPASAVGAPHDRDRIWIVAYPNPERSGIAPKQSGHNGPLLWDALPAAATVSLCGDVWDQSILPTLGLAHGVSTDVDAVGGFGNAVVPQIPEIIGRAIMSAEPSDTREAGPITNPRER